MIAPDPFAQMLNQESYDRSGLPQQLTQGVKSKSKSYDLTLELSQPDALKEVVRKFSKRDFAKELTPTGLHNLKRLCNDLHPTQNAKATRIYTKAIDAINKQKVKQVLPQLANIDSIDFRNLFDRTTDAAGKKATFETLCIEALKAGKLHTLLNKAMPLPDTIKAEVKEALLNHMRHERSVPKGLFSHFFGPKDAIRLPYDHAPISIEAREAIDTLITEALFEALSEITSFKALSALQKDKGVEELAKTGIKLAIQGAKGGVVSIEIPKSEVTEKELSRAIEHVQKVREFVRSTSAFSHSGILDTLMPPDSHANYFSHNLRLLGIWVQGTKSLETALVNEQKKTIGQEYSWLQEGVLRIKKEMRRGDTQEIVTTMSLAKAKTLLDKATTFQSLLELKGVMQELRDVHLLPSPWYLQEVYNETKNGNQNKKVEASITQALQSPSVENVKNATTALQEHLERTRRERASDILSKYPAVDRFEKKHPFKPNS